MDHPVEIIAKKIFYRTTECKPRDIFDLATVYQNDAASLCKCSSIFSPNIDELAHRLDMLIDSGRFSKEMEDIALQKKGYAILRKAPALCSAFIESIRSKMSSEEDNDYSPSM